MGSNKPSMRGVHLNRSFGSGEVKSIALNDVSIELYPGQITVLMGPSGSGKSTLLSILSGLLRPDSGKVLALGEDLWRMSDAERERFRLKHFGFIFQGYNLFPALTARQQLELVLRWGEKTPAPEARKRAEQMLELLGLGKKGHLRPSQLSGGEKQRVAIGRALVKNPEFCFADEPTSALDWSHGENIVDQLRNAAHSRDATILVVTHDARIVRYADQVLHLLDGALVEQSAAEEPAHPMPNIMPSYRFDEAMEPNR